MKGDRIDLDVFVVVLTFFKTLILFSLTGFETFARKVLDLIGLFPSVNGKTGIVLSSSFNFSFALIIAYFGYQMIYY